MLLLQFFLKFVISLGIGKYNRKFISIWPYIKTKKEFSKKKTGFKISTIALDALLTILAFAKISPSKKSQNC